MIEMKLHNCNFFATAFSFAYNSRISMIGTVVTNVVPILVPVLDVKNA